VEIATLASGMLSTTFLGSGIISPTEAIVLWLTGSFGGILPDIDSDNSASLNIVFSIITVFFIAMSFFFMYLRYSTLIIWGSCILIYCMINLILRPLFEAATVHRGIFHSIITGLFISLIFINISYHLGNQSAELSWMIGIFLLFGYIVHLLLDEVYSVDVNNNLVKRSFGTALKLFDYKNLAISTIMIIATLVGFYATPKSTEIYIAVTDKKTYLMIKKSFIPSRLMSL
jgi:hypothetical protein